MGNVKIRIRYVVKENRNTDYYDVGQIWYTHLSRKRKTIKIVWNKWIFNKRIVIFGYKQIEEE